MNRLVIYLSLLGLSFIISLVRYRHLPGYLRLMPVLLGFSLLIEIPGYILRVNNINNLFLFHIYDIVEYVLIGIMYINAYHSIVAKKYVKVSIFIYLIFCLINSIFFQKIFQTADTYNFLVGCVLKTFIVLIYFYEIYQSNDNEKIENLPLFWISVGNFFFFTGTFFVMGLIEEIKIYNAQLADSLHIINTVLNYLMYIMYSIGLLKKKHDIRG